MKANIKMIKSTVKALLNGKMAENMLEHGKMGNRMDLEHIIWKMGKK